MEDKKEITAVDYDALLPLFFSKDDFRPAYKQANTVGEYTYSTDAYALIIIPNWLLVSIYEPHVKVPDYKSVIEQIGACPHITYKDTDLFKALEATPKDFDEKECSKCDGEGKCWHCDADCDPCNGTGKVEDRAKPLVYTERSTIQIGDHHFTPLQLGRLEKVLIETGVEKFQVVGQSNFAIRFKVGEIDIIICRYDRNNHYKGDDLPNVILPTAMQ